MSDDTSLSLESLLDDIRDIQEEFRTGSISRAIEKLGIVEDQLSELVEEEEEE